LKKEVITYAHTQDIGNGLVECWENLLHMPLDAEFKFLSEAVDKKIGLPKSR